MNWPRIIVDGLAMSVLFNAVVGMGFLLWPQEYSTMFPREIKEAAAPYVDKAEVRKMKLLLYLLYLLLFIWWGVSAGLAGIKGFWPQVLKKRGILTLIWIVGAAIVAGLVVLFF